MMKKKRGVMAQNELVMAITALSIMNFFLDLEQTLPKDSLKIHLEEVESA